jgi:type IV pilus assembly protein PilA
MISMKKLKERKLNDNGFSLVELIIVIAIMAVLVGVLAPQYLKYVEKSRRSADIDNWDTIISAIEIYASDPDNSGDITSDAVSVEFTGKGEEGSAGGWAKDALEDVGINISSISMKSNIFGESSISVTSDDESGISITITGGDDDDSLATALGRAEVTTTE